MECGCLVSTANNTPSNTRLSNQQQFNTNLKKQEFHSKTQKRTPYKNGSHINHMFEVLNSLRKDEVLCDIKLETEDGTLMYGHKVVLASATPYFRAMFTNFEGNKKKHIIIRELDSTALKLLINYIYTGQILVTEYNVQVLLQAANLLQLLDIKEACCDFLQTQLDPKNCLRFKELVSLYDCSIEYLSNFKSYILQNFSEMVENNYFLNVPYDELVDLISCDELNDSSEEKVFESVVNWVNHDLRNRKNVFPKLMEHVRLPSASKEYLCNRVREEPLVKSSFECRDYLEEALCFHISKSVKSNVIRTKPRQPVDLPKVILVIGKHREKQMQSIQWFDPSTNTWQLCSELSVPQSPGNLAVLNDRYLFYLQNDCEVHMMDLFSQSPCFSESVPMLIDRKRQGIGMLDNCIYAVGGFDGTYLNSAEVFNYTNQEWQMISKMSTARNLCGIGVLNNHIYAVGGYNRTCLKSVERYCPRTDTWTQVVDMNESRYYPGVGVLNGVMYVVGGFNGRVILNSVEVYNPKSNTWTFVSAMHRRRIRAGVVALNGLLYVVSQEDKNIIFSAEIFDPKSNIWTLLTPEMNICGQEFGGAAVVNKYSFFKF